MDLLPSLKNIAVHSCFLNKTISWLWHCLLTYALGPSTQKTMFLSTLCLMFSSFVSKNEVICKIWRDNIVKYKSSSLQYCCSAVDKLVICPQQLWLLFEGWFSLLGCPLGYCVINSMVAISIWGLSTAYCPSYIAIFTALNQQCLCVCCSNLILM